jgi:beta-mannosidase
VPRSRVESHEVERLGDGWLAASAPAGDPVAPDRLDELDWLPARVPGTAAAALRDAGLWRPHDRHDFDAEDWWFRTRFRTNAAAPNEEVVLRFGGIATLADAYLNGERILTSDSMFAAHAVEVGERLQAENELAIRCRALTPALGSFRSPRARWRTKIVADGNLRFVRTMLYGRAPGYAPGPAAVGPWRGVELERRRDIAVDELTLRTSLDGTTGLLDARARLRLLGDGPVSARLELSGPSGRFETGLELVPDGAALVGSGELAVPNADCWWPHTHGTPHLHRVEVVVDAAGQQARVDAGRVGFRQLSAGPRADHDLLRDGLDLHVNGIRVFVRGALWMPVDFVGLAPDPDELRATLERARAAGMNMLRLPGTTCYEDDLFHDLCDELGILVWQDFMFANFDYPIANDDFREAAAAEVREQLVRLGGRPSLAVLCGNSEVEQQVAMLGLDPALGRGELFDELLPQLVDDAAVDAVFVPSTPCGGDMPFRTSSGIANYYGVAGFFRPLSDARLADVRFAAECLPFANVPEAEALEEVFSHDDPVVHDPRWKAGVQRDPGVSWDFDDVRDHYLGELFTVDPVELRRTDPERYLELSRAVTGEVMAEVFGEWRRSASRCGGGLVLWLRDLLPGAGWGVLDHRGEPKAAYHHLRRILAPVALWTTDEGLGGIDIHVANDRPDALSGHLRVTLYRDFEHPVGEAHEPLNLSPHESIRRGVEELLGRFVDVSWSYRFGPPAQDVVVVSLEDEAEWDGVPISQSLRFPAGRSTAAEPAEWVGLAGEVGPGAGDELLLRLSTRRLAHGVRVRVPGYEPSEDAFFVEPGRTRLIRLLPRGSDVMFAGGELTALNLQGRVRVSAGTAPGERESAAVGDRIVE